VEATGGGSSIHGWGDHACTTRESPRMVIAMEMATQIRQLQMDHFLYRNDREALNVQSILVDAALDVGALIDAVCCRCGDWVDWQHYRPLPGISAGNHDGPGSIIRLALAEDIFGLRAGGYIEMCAMPEHRVVEVCGGYFDAYDQPKPVIDGSLRWHEVNHQNVGQALILMHGRIIRAYMVREESDDRLCLGQWGVVEGDWQFVRQPAGPLQNTMRERSRM